MPIRISRFLGILLLTLAATVVAADSDGNCVIGVTPAATLLLPYFEVDLENRLGENTLFTVTNTSDLEQFGRVTLWTDYAFPVVSFDLYFAPHELRRINLYDVIVQGSLDPRDGTPVCGPRALPPAYLQRVRMAFTEGRVLPMGNQVGCNEVGSVHQNAVGYVTVDVVGSCESGTTPLDARHFAEDLRFDNVFIGDYQQISARDNFAQSSPAVHIRAFPEGGTPQLRNNNPAYAVTLPRTFYERFQDRASPKLDARQPLPSTFAFRWIRGGKGQFETSVKIWREGILGKNGTCATYRENGRLHITDLVVFDEDANGEGIHVPDNCPVLCAEPPGFIRLPVTSRVSIADKDVFPHDIVDDALSGWAYVNLDHDDHDLAHRPQQAWVVTSMRAEGRYSVDIDAAILSDGCSPDVDITAFSKNGKVGTFPGADVIP